MAVFSLEQRMAYLHVRMVALGKARVLKAQEVAREGDPDRIGGPLIIAVGVRESGLRNVLGDFADDPRSHGADFDWGHARGAFQLYDTWNWSFLRSVVGCPGVKIAEFTRLNWIPVPGTKASWKGMCPTWEDGARRVVGILRDHIQSAAVAGVANPSNQLRIALAAYNCGFNPALRGHSMHQPDAYTTLKNYSQDVLARKREVDAWLSTHRAWKL